LLTPYDALSSATPLRRTTKLLGGASETSMVSSGTSGPSAAIFSRARLRRSSNLVRRSAGSAVSALTNAW
jgi:hypothetical protein